MSQTPNDKVLESLSALVDDEASELELHRLLKLSEDNEELLDRWQTYNLIGSLMRKESEYVLPDSVNFAARVASQLEAEPTCEAEENAPAKQVPSRDGRKTVKAVPNQLWGMFGKVSVAASFAAGLIFSVNIFNDGLDGVDQSSGSLAQDPASVESSQQTSVASAPKGFQMPSIGVRTVSQSNVQPAYFQDIQRPVVIQPVDNLSDLQTQEMLNDMLIFHTERASVNGGLSMMPYARVSKMRDAQ